MKNNKKLSDAIGHIDQKYIDEYVSSRRARRPMMWRAVIAAALAVALLAGAAIGLPYLTRGNHEIGDDLPNKPNPGPDPIQIPDSASGVEYITDNAGNRVLHVMDTLEIPQDIAHSMGIDLKMEAAEMVFYNWSNIIDVAKQSTSPDQLIFIGTPVSKDVYVWDEEVTINGEGWVVEYDVASGTTALKEMYECEPYQAIRRTTVQLSGIRIDEILKENNTTGYQVGDVIYFYLERASMIDELAKTPVNDMSIHHGDTVIDINPGIPDNDMSIHHGDTEIAVETGLADIPTNDMSIRHDDTEIAIEPALPIPETAVETGLADIPTNDMSIRHDDTEIAIEPALPIPETAVDSSAYIPATTTPALPFMPAPTTAVTPETTPEIDINGDNKVDAQDRVEDANTLPSSGQRMYVAHVNTREVSDIVKNSGIVPEQLWSSTHSCTAEEYRSGKLPNDISNMP